MHDHSRRTPVIASLATLATFLDTTVLFVAFPDITRTFTDASPSQLSWVLNAYTIVFAAPSGSSSGLTDPVVAFDSIWWLIVAGGLGTCLLVLPMRTRGVSRWCPYLRDDTRPGSKATR